MMNTAQTNSEPGEAFPATGDRILSLDALRGLIMILMALDHASFLIARVHPGEFWGVPLPVYRESLAFVTRFVSHFCAPGFFFLMGTGMVLFAASRRHYQWTDRRIMRHFLLRGLILIIMQFVIENAAWLLGSLSGPVPVVTIPGGGDMLLLHFGVLYGLGASMIVWALALRFNTGIVLTISAIAILATQVFTPSPENASLLYPPLLRALLIPGRTGILQAYYPLIPWLGFCGLGVTFGRALRNDRSRTFRVATIAAMASLVLFGVLRLANGFGNFHPVQRGWIGFLNVTKYPPSLTFTFLTLGLNLLLLSLFEKNRQQLQRWGKPLMTYGKTALFFYIVHIYLYALIGFIFPGRTSFTVMYPIWLLGLILLYPLCRWYGNFKRRIAPDSVWRFF